MSEIPVIVSVFKAVSRSLHIGAEEAGTDRYPMGDN